MKKISVLYFDNERQKYRVAMGERQNIHIGRYDTLQEAQRVQMAIMKAYEEGEKAALKSCDNAHEAGYETGYTNGFDNGVRWGFAKGLDYAKEQVEQIAMNVDAFEENSVVEECVSEAKSINDYEGA